MITLRKCRVCEKERPAVEFSSYRPLMCGPCGKAAKAAVAKREREKNAAKYRVWKRAYRKTDKGRATEERSRRANYSYERNAAQMAVKWALKTGALTRLPCIICGEYQSEAHHSSYAKDMRLCVTWLCKEHHAQLHIEHARYEYAQRSPQ